VWEHFLSDCTAFRANELADTRPGIIQLSHWETVLVGTVNKSSADWLFFGFHLNKYSMERTKREG
jgi:hypothetical protein